MLKGKEKRDLSMKTILSLISEYDIFRYYMPLGWEIGTKTYSPFRVEDDPSFLIGNKYGNLTFIDFTDTDKRGDCFDFVRFLYGNITLHEALLQIDKDFGLGICSQGTDRYKQIIKEYKQPDTTDVRNTFIQVKTRNFTNEELAYWNMYHQDISDLKREHIYSIKELYLNRKKVFVKDTELKFAYFYDGRWKIYTPFAVDKKKKWFPNNVPITIMDGKSNLTPDKKAFINKSKKDYMVISKILPNSCAVQNEGIACFSEENVQFIKENSAGGILSFDSDETGVKNSIQIIEIFGYDYCNVPKNLAYKKIKDWAEWAKQEGLQKVENYLKSKHIIT